MHATVSTVMTRELVTARPTTPYQELVGLLHVHRVNALPVVEADGRLVGIVSDADLALKTEHRPGDHVRFLPWMGARGRAARAKAAGRIAAEVMTRQLVTTTPETSISAAARLLRRRGIRHLPVVDPSGRLVGMVTRRDLLAVFQRPDQELRHQIERAILVASLDLDPDQVTVEVNDGVVTLRGHLPWQRLGHDLVELITALDGVVTVDDQLTYTFTRTPVE